MIAMPHRRHWPWLALWSLIFAPTLLWLWGRWTMSVWHNGHGMFMPIVVAWLVRERLALDRAAEREESSVWGFPALVPGLLCAVADSALHTGLLAAVGMILTLPALSLLLLGARRTESLLWPWLFSFLMLPIPAAFVESITLALRTASATGAERLLHLCGVSVFRDQTTLQVAGSTVSIAEACSGFSTLYLSIALALFLAYLNPKPLRRAIVFAAAVPVAVGANILRCMALVLLVDRSGAGILATFLHPLSGMLSFILATAILCLIGRPPLAQTKGAAA